jgi:hypothetical protein
VFFETLVLNEHDRVEPESGNLPITFNMDVWRFASVRTEEDETIRPILKNSRHKY